MIIETYNYVWRLILLDKKVIFRNCCVLIVVSVISFAMLLCTWSNLTDSHEIIYSNTLGDPVQTVAS
jgi:hypothetical protein